jgi:hypothetical protein
VTIQLEKYHYLLIAAISIIAGFVIYSVLSYLLMPTRIIVPISIIMSMLIFGLCEYYCRPQIDQYYTEDRYSNSGNGKYVGRTTQRQNGSLSFVIFVITFAIIIAIPTFTNNQTIDIFIHWSGIGVTDIINIAAAIMLCFFIPGYALVLIIAKKYKINPILTVLLAYLFSILVTGSTAYILALSFDRAVSESKHLFLGIYLLIFIIFVYYRRDRIIQPLRKIKYHFSYEFASSISYNFSNYLKSRASQLLVFGSLVMLLIVATYSIYGITIRDQWFHQGRAILFMSGTFRDAALNGADAVYPPFQSALLAALTTISGVPLVNSYVSIAFLNIIAVFAFYYFFSRWVSPHLYRASTLASSLFALSSGFNWIYFLSLTVTIHPIISPHSFLGILNNIGTLTIIRPTNFIFSAEPDFSTGLIYIALPAGLVLLGLLREKFQAKLHYVAIVAMISTIGILSHDEFFLFIILGSLIPLIFKIKGQNYFYLGLTLSFTIIFLIDRMIPVSYYTANEIFGIPLLYLNVLFVFLTWIFYMGRQKLQSLRTSSTAPSKIKQKTSRFKNSGLFVLALVVISLISYMYILGYITFAQLSIVEVKADTRGFVVPWYLYPMKLGLVGLLGLIFILSYFFKRFDKNLFVFGLIILVAFIAGNYYDEHRFSKFMMLGLVALASVFIYRILIGNFKNKFAINVAVISAIIMFSSFSVLMFIGQNSLVEQTQDYTINPMQKFPSRSEMDLFDSLRHDMNISPKKFNIVSFPSAYNFTKASPLISKLQGFSGFPYGKLLQSPLTLNSSTLDAFYKQLGYSDARYIILLKNSTHFPTGLKEPIHFALENFNPLYEDDQYTVLNVPPVEPPSSSSSTNIALLYNQRDDLLPYAASQITELRYNNNTFDFKGKGESAVIQKNNTGLLLYGSKTENGTSLWSKLHAMGTNVNYVDTKFRITSENQSKSDQARLKWREGNKQYYVSLSNDGLQLNQQSINNQVDKKIFKNTEIKKKPWIWYPLKIESLDNSINVYVDNALKIQAPKDLVDNNYDNISRVALTSLHNNVEFGSIQIGRVSDYSQKINEKTKYENYYPLSLLALSNSRYDIFRDDDFSAFSKDVIIRSDAVKIDNSTFNKYLDYVNGGGRLIVINSNSNYNQTFSRLFQIHSNSSNVEAFTSLSGNKDNKLSINVPGLIKDAQVEPFSNVKVIASYRDINNHTLAPFAIEKLFSNGGRIVLVNAGGYFNAISNSPRQYFLSLSNISKLLGLDLSKVTNYANTSVPRKGFIGNMDISGDISLKSSSIIPVDKTDYPYKINASRIEIGNKTNGMQKIFDNVSIKSLRLIGDYNVIINYTGRLQLPDMISKQNYISLFIPSEFNMTIILLPDKPRTNYLEMVTQNDSGIKSLIVNGESKVDFYNVRAGDSSISLPILLKNPEIKVNGNTSIKHANLHGYLTQRGDPNKGTPLDVQGELNAKFDYVDDYNQPFRNGTRTDFVTFLQGIAMNGTIDEHSAALKLPAHILDASGKELDMTLIKAIGSPMSITILLVISMITIILGKLIWRKKVL